jgi:predicted RNA-binding protein with RPS1 domain
MVLPLDAKIQVISRLVDDFVHLAENGVSVPDRMTYKVISSENGGGIERSARLVAFATMDPQPITKFAFDTRRVDQESDRNPRKNLQYWHRSDQFVDENDEKTLKTFAKLAKVLKRMKNKLGTQPEWFESYARQLYDNVYRILRVKEADLDIFRPQINYLEQLVFARYRLTKENLEKFSEDKLEQCILAKDEDLIGRSNYLKETEPEEQVKPQGFSKDSNATTQESIVNAIFGGANMRRDGERTVERTITITIRDNVID